MDHNFSGKPWFAKVEADETYSFEVDVNTLKVKETKGTPWEEEFGPTFEATGEFRNIEDSDGEEYEKDGEHMVPFWACEAFQEQVGEGEPNKKGWLKMEYIRNEADGENRDGKPVKLSGAAFRCV